MSKLIPAIGFVAMVLAAAVAASASPLAQQAHAATKSANVMRLTPRGGTDFIIYHGIRWNLTGIRYMWPNVVDIESAKELGIDDEALQAFVESRIRAAGIRTDWHVPVACLIVEVKTASLPNNGTIAIVVTSNICEVATLARLRRHWSNVVSWQHVELGIAADHKAKNKISELISRTMDAFTRDYLRDNPYSGALRAGKM